MEKEQSRVSVALDKVTEARLKYEQSRTTKDHIAWHEEWRNLVMQGQIQAREIGA